MSNLKAEENKAPNVYCVKEKKTQKSVEQVDKLS